MYLFGAVIYLQRQGGIYMDIFIYKTISLKLQKGHVVNIHMNEKIVYTMKNISLT